MSVPAHYGLVEVSYCVSDFMSDGNLLSIREKDGLLIATDTNKAAAMIDGYWIQWTKSIAVANSLVGFLQYITLCITPFLLSICKLILWNNIGFITGTKGFSIVLRHLSEPISNWYRYGIRNEMVHGISIVMFPTIKHCLASTCIVFQIHNVAVPLLDKIDNFTTI